MFSQAPWYLAKLKNPKVIQICSKFWLFFKVINDFVNGEIKQASSRLSTNRNSIPKSLKLKL